MIYACLDPDLWLANLVIIIKVIRTMHLNMIHCQSILVLQVFFQGSVGVIQILVNISFVSSTKSQVTIILKSICVKY